MRQKLLMSLQIGGKVPLIKLSILLKKIQIQKVQLNKKREKNGKLKDKEREIKKKYLKYLDKWKKTVLKQKNNIEVKQEEKGNQDFRELECQYLTPQIRNQYNFMNFE